MLPVLIVDTCSTLMNVICYSLITADIQYTFFFETHNKIQTD